MFFKYSKKEIKIRSNLKVSIIKTIFIIYFFINEAGCGGISPFNKFFTLEFEALKNLIILL